MQERRYQFKEDLLKIHKKGIRNYQLSPDNEEVELKNSIQLVMPQDADIVIETALRDFEDYLFKSMDVYAWVTPTPTTSSQKVLIELFPDSHSDIDIKFDITVTDNEITVKGENSRSIAQGFYYLESLMNLKCAPFLKKGTISKKTILNTVTDMHRSVCMNILTKPLHIWHIWV
ncbi:MAG: hypothetical protein IKW59_02475 [Clostridia bacterium]|nr:hypothetical protein [Clostridia bacterium]